MNTEDQEVIFARAWKAFCRAVKSDNAAADMIFRSLRADGRIRCSCSRSKIKRNRGARFYVCMNCKSKYWFTSGTLFEGASCLRAWLAAVWFKDKGIAVSSSALAKLVDVAQSTALNMQKKVSLVIYEAMSDDAPVVGIARLVDAIIKRSKDTPASCHPRVELETPAEDATDVAEESSQTLLPMCVSAPLTGQILFFLRYFFHGVSRKYLQLYVVAYCCYGTDSKWEKGSVLKACLKHAPIHYEQLLNFSSPQFLKVEGI